MCIRDRCRSAKTQLDVLFYIVARDEVGIAFVNALTDRARDGVRVRLLMDRFGNLKPPRVALRALTEAGGEVLYFSPLLQRPDSGHLNLRNHRKMVIADGVQVFAGEIWSSVDRDVVGNQGDNLQRPDFAFCRGVLETPLDLAGQRANVEQPIGAKGHDVGIALHATIDRGQEALRHLSLIHI